MEEFQEISHTGGKIIFQYKPNEGIFVRIENCNPSPATIFQICISFDGQIIDYVSFFSGPGSFYPQPSLLIPLLSDREGMFGQKCRKCKSYFRTSILSSTTICPYCGYKTRGVEFLTNNQVQYLTLFFNTYMEVLHKPESKEIDLDFLISKLTKNTPSWVYYEERLQLKVRCSACKCVFDVLGKYACCPYCGTPNYKLTLESELSLIELEATQSVKNSLDVPGELLSKTFGEYESFSNAIKNQLLQLPATEDRKKEIKKISFQMLDESEKKVDHFFSIKISKGLSSDDLAFLRKMINRRHIIVHNSGIVDEQYLKKTEDSSVRMNERVKISVDDIKKTVRLLKVRGENFFLGWQDIQGKSNK